MQQDFTIIERFRRNRTAVTIPQSKIRRFLTAPFTQGSLGRRKRQYKNNGDDSMFPAELDNAKVLYYTPYDDYGAIKYPNGEVANYYHYLAICSYSRDDEYYLFCCNENYEVVSDWIDSSIEKCMEVAASSYKENIQWIKTY